MGLGCQSHHDEKSPTKKSMTKRIKEEEVSKKTKLI